MLIFRPQSSQLAAAGNFEAVMAAVKPAPILIVTPGGHLVLTDVCSPAMRAASPETCTDAPGIDRTAIQDRMHSEILAFFRRTL